jgi:hypothetical protein
MVQKGKMTTGSHNSDLQKRFNLELTPIIATCNLSYNCVHQESFRNFVAFLNPNFTAKGRYSMSRELTSLLYKILEVSSGPNFD